MFPKYIQTDERNCGPTALRIIAKHYGLVVSPAKLSELCYTSKSGSSLMGISDGAERLGFHTIGVRLTWDKFRNEAPLPCIVHWNQNHFVVVYKIKKHWGKTYVFVSDPAVGLIKYQEDAFLQSWLEKTETLSGLRFGKALLLEPTPLFYSQRNALNQDIERFNLRHLVKYLKPHYHSIIQILIAMIVAILLSLLLPFITQSVVDYGITLGRLGFVKTMLIAQLFIVLGQLANELIRNWLMLHMTARVSISLISDFLAKLMRLPISFFDLKKTGDILQRIQDHNRIQDFLTNSLLSIVMAVVLLILYGGILGGYNLKILLVFFIGSVLYVGWIVLFLRWRRKLDYQRFQVSADNQSSIVQLIDGMQEIKLNNCEKQKRWEWENIQARLFHIKIKGLSLSQAQQIGGTCIDQVKNVLISYLAAKFVIDGNMTLGMMTALTYIVGQLNAPIGQFISFIREAQDANISMERLGEIHCRKDEEAASLDKIHEIPINADIEFRNVVFQYEGPHSPKVLDHVSMRIPHNRVTAIVGPSGSGKTTILKLLLGYYTPVDGSVTLGGVSLESYSESSWRRNCGCVMQDGYVFNNSIAENIGLCDDIPDPKRVRQAAEIANINEWIEQLPQGYYTQIGNEGHGLSMGQKQRILIARAAYKDSPFLFFDEATNSLDANNEKTIIERLGSLFKNKTVVIVAHRLSTVKNADNIIVLNNGQIVEEGPHSDLIKAKGYYYHLVHNQLELGD